MAARAIVDSGFLVALGDRRDALHSWARELAHSLRGPWLTCEACISETVFFLGDDIGPEAVLGFYRSLESGALVSRHFLPEHLSRVVAETARYRRRVVDFADACLMALSDEHPALPLVSTDSSDFAVYFRTRPSRTLLLPHR